MIDWDAIDTVLLDMDGTLLDLHFDNHFWQEHVPARYAERHSLPHAEARSRLTDIYRARAGTLDWYCVDYWTRELQLDIARLKEEVAHLIAVHPDVPLFGLALALFPLAFLDPNVGRSVPPATVLRWLPVMLPLLLVQIAAEELIFRGYLLQQLAARSRSPWVWMVAPSVLFGALHYSPAEFGPMALWPALWAMGFGCLAADLTARTGNLGAALALHFTNNLSSMILVGLYGQLDGLALYTIVINPRDPAAFGPYLAADVAAMLVAWLAARLALRV